MERVFRISDFVTAPRRRYYVGATFVAWCASETLGGTVVWGHPSDGDGAELAQLWEYDRQLQGPLDVVSDFAALEGVDPIAFERLLGYVEHRLPDYNAHVRRHALVRPRGMSGAVISGFNSLLQPTYEWQVFADRAAAFAWIGRNDELHEVMTELQRTVIGRTRIVAEVARLLADEPRLSVEEAAAKLRYSPRTLQRELQDAGSSFRAQVAQARLAQAQLLLRSTDQKLGAIALAVGLKSASQLVRLFNQELREPPGAYRERMRESNRVALKR